MSIRANQLLCLNCAVFIDLVFLGRGNPDLTRRSRKYSDMCVIVVKFSRVRKPNISLSKLVQYLKVKDGRKLLMEFEHLRKKYWDQHL